MFTDIINKPGIAFTVPEKNRFDYTEIKTMLFKKSYYILVTDKDSVYNVYQLKIRMHLLN